jgi:hypothetical protein
MLYSIDTGKYVSRIPHKKDFDKWIKNLSDEDYKKIEDEINSKIDQNNINRQAGFQVTIGQELYTKQYIKLVLKISVSQDYSLDSLFLIY